jgi:MOSC domain-containing protein YiiM
MPNLRQVHLIPSELLDALRADGYELRSGDLGENIMTAGLDLEAMPSPRSSSSGRRPSSSSPGENALRFDR